MSHFPAAGERRALLSINFPIVTFVAFIYFNYFIVNWSSIFIVVASRDSDATLGNLFWNRAHRKALRRVKPVWISSYSEYKQRNSGNADGSSGTGVCSSCTASPRLQPIFAVAFWKRAKARSQIDRNFESANQSNPAACFREPPTEIPKHIALIDPDYFFGVAPLFAPNATHGFPLAAISPLILIALLSPCVFMNASEKNRSLCYWHQTCCRGGCYINKLIVALGKFVRDNKINNLYKLKLYIIKNILQT